ncbi:MAG TPA: class I SAM-dependent methyltransferase, partial [Anaeromyxobacteraceae bacterium]|nr:class I SAM-dependent methyltransferase [Anaeromyxobacteraceae bacterium]
MTERFEAAYAAGTPPWDIGRPQPAVVRLAEAGAIQGDVLDVGCGTGENALFLAGRGHRVLGVDAVAAAIARAQAKAAERGIAAEFRVADALRLRSLHRRFETAIDVGLFHALTDEERRLYRDSLCEVLSSGSTLHLLCFSDEEPPGPGPRRVSEYEIRSAFRGVFALADEIRPETFERLGQEPAKA